jgi:hypothetical protein
MFEDFKTDLTTYPTPTAPTVHNVLMHLGILMYYGMVKPLAGMSFAQRELAYDHKTVPHTNPTTKIAV